MSHKYISFDWWWGGFNNIRMCYEMVGAMSYVSGRKIILPPPGYCLFLSEHQDKKTFWDIWEVLDKKAFTDNFDCVDYNETSLVKYSSKIQNYDGICKDIKCILFNDKDINWGPQKFIGQGLIYHSIEDINHFNEFNCDKRQLYDIMCDDEIIHFPRNLLGHFGYHVYAPNTSAQEIIRQKIKRGIKFHDKYIQKANSIMDGDFDAVHIRRGDFKYTQTSWTEDMYKNLLNLLNANVRKNVPLFIATDETDYTMFDFLKKTYNIFFLKDFCEVGKAEALVLDTLICSNAYQFYGSRMSTFSDYINIIRGYNNKLDNHRKSLNFNRPKIKYNKYPWEVESYNWQDLWGELYYGKI